jgi:hypothetical protein
MIRLLAPILALALAIATSPLSGALADDAKEKAAAVTTEQAAQPKIRVILPASWEPAIPQTPPQAASPQRSAAR